MAIINGNNTIFATLNGNQFFIDSTLDVDAFVYGWHVDPTISDPAQAITYLADAVGKTPAAMGASTFSYGDWADAFFMPKPCMLKYDGTVAYYLDPNDYTKKADGTPSDVANASFDGNAMMEWPLIWYKFEAGTAEGEGYFYCSNKQVDSSYKCWCNYDANNNIIPHFYTAIYNGTGTNKLRSLSGVRTTATNGCAGITAETEIHRALANNTSSNVEWYTAVFSDRQLINALLVLIGKSINIPMTFGLGYLGNEMSKKESYMTGSLNTKGLFYGTTANETTAVKIFGMENWWGLVGCRTAGLIGAGTRYAYKLTYGTADGTTITGYNSTGNGYKSAPGTTEAGFIIRMSFGEYGFLPSHALPASDGGNDHTYYCAFKHTSIEGYAAFGDGDVTRMKLSGPFKTVVDPTLYASTYFDMGTMLSCKPILQSN